MASPSVPLRKLGKNGPKVPALGFGLMGMSVPVYGSHPSEEDQFAILDHAYEIGARNWDTSDLYGGGEDVVGKWLKQSGKRGDIFLATKFGYVKGAKDFSEFNSSGPYTKEACAESLKRLETDYIDLYYLHQPNRDTPIEETMRALKELKEEGKIKYIGLSGISSATLRRALKIAPVDAVQIEYSPFVLHIEGTKGTNLLATCRELGTAIVCYSPLGRGLLTSVFAGGETRGDAKDMRPGLIPRFHKDNVDHNIKVVNQFKAFADKKGCGVTQLALAWLMKQGDDIIPIPGTKKIKYLDENWGSLGVTVSDEEEAEIRKFLESVEIAGGNLPPKYEDHGYADTKEEA